MMVKVKNSGLSNRLIENVLNEPTQVKRKNLFFPSILHEVLQRKIV